jgi:hypothetical protein
VKADYYNIIFFNHGKNLVKLKKRHPAGWRDAIWGFYYILKIKSIINSGEPL